ncbi:MAG: DUF2953 domain-containing protein [Eubacteriales bacterium]|nr:DUF2953 domain-containing protein [Eubacteriales bacterium]
MKVILWIILGILIFILALLLYVICVPFVYRLDFGYTDGYARARVRSFLFLITGDVRVLKAGKGISLPLTVKVAGIKAYEMDLMKLKEKSGEDSIGDGAKESAKASAEGVSKTGSVSTVVMDEATGEGTSEKQTVDTKKQTNDTEKQQGTEETKFESGVLKDIPKYKSPEEIKRLREKEAIGEEQKSTSDKVKETLDQIKEFGDRLGAEENERAKKRLFKRIRSVLKSILPRWGDATLTIGTGDPYHTAVLFELFSIIYPFIGKNTELTPDLNNEVFEGKGRLTGLIHLLPLIINAAILWFDKGIKEIINGKREN